MKKSVAYVLCVCALVCAILTAVSLGTPVWISNVLGGSEGLFEICYSSGSCVKVSESLIPDYTKAVQAFLIIAVLALVINSAYAILVSLKKAPGKGIPIFFGSAALCTLIAMAVFTGKLHDVANIPGNSYGYSYILGWIVFGLDVVLVPVSFILSKVSEYSVIP